MNSTSRRIPVFLYQPEQTGERLRARLEFGVSDGQLELVELLGAPIPRLDDALQHVNKAEALFLSVAAPAGSPQFAEGQARIVRGDPRFLDAVKSYLVRYYGLRLA